MPPQRPPRKGNHPSHGPRSRSNHPGGPPRKGPNTDRHAGQAPKRRASAGPKAPASKSGEASGAERLQKILAHAGVGSRRACEDLILQGRVTVGGKTIRELGTKVEPGTPVAVDGQKVQLERPVYFAVYKPKGYVSTNNDPSGRPRVLDLLPEIPQRVYSVGRLDEMSVGLMLLTNDGELANKLAHPKFGVEKLYRVIVAGSPTREVLGQLVEGIWLAEGKVRAKSVRAVGKKGEATILEMVLAEGKNREVRRMLAKLGHKVMSLTRVAVGPITIKGLTAGQFRPLTGREVDLLRRVADGQPVPMPWMSDRKPRREPGRPRRPANQGPSPSPEPPRGFRDRPGPSHGTPTSRGPGLPVHPGTPPSERQGAGRPPLPRPTRSPSGRREFHGEPPRSNGSGPYRGNGPRPSNQGGEGPRRRFEGHGPSGPSGPPRPNGPRPFRQDGPPRPTGGRRPGPPTGQEPPRRRIIGLVLPPEPVEVPNPKRGRDDRPKPRELRPTGKRPMPIGGSRPMPKSRKPRGGPEA